METETDDQEIAERRRTMAGTFKLKNFNGETREYDRAAVEAYRIKSSGKIMYFLHARRHELYREIWDLIECSDNVEKIVDYAESLNAMVEDEDGESE